MKIIPSALLISSLAALSLNAQDAARAGRIEVFGVAQYTSRGDQDGLVIDVDGIVAPVAYGSAFGGGLGMGYNLNDHWNLNFTFTGGTVDARTRLNGAWVDSSALAFSLGLNVDYNFLSSPLTPLLTAGITMDEFADSLDSNTGFVRHLEYLQPMIGFGGGAGVRWDLGNHWFLKAVYRGYYRMGVVHIDGEDFVHGGQLSLGYRF